MNRMLARQLRRAGLSPEVAPVSREDWQRFLSLVGAAYDEADRGRYLLERSMEISSRELQEAARSLAAMSARQVERSEQHYRHVFSILPVAAWEEDFSGVAARLAELRRCGVVDLDRYFDEHPGELADCVRRVRILDFNAAVTDLIGEGDPARLLGQVDPTSLTEGSMGSWRREFQAIWEERGKVEFEFTGERLDGSVFAGKLHWNAAHIDDSYDYSRVMVVVVDISDRAAAEERMRRLVQAKDEFLASVSHELRTPLTSVVGYADLLRSGDGDAGEQAEMITTIAQQAADLSEIVEDLLIGARVDLGQLEVAARQVDLAALVVQLVGASRHPVTVSVADEAMQVIGDAGRVRQILRNLLSNAERYGGAHRRIEIGRDEGTVIVAVCDDGPPLAGDVADRIFDRYYRVDDPSSPPGSVGIGLTISRELAHLMGGTLTYRHDGVWARFELGLPASVPALRAVS